MKKENPHAGHRRRLKEKYKKGGFEILSFHEIIELALFFTIPRKDTNRIAHELERKFGQSLVNMVNASDSLMKEIDRIGDESLLFMRFCIDLLRMYNLELTNQSKSFCSKESHEDFLVAYYKGKQKEEFVLVTLNNRMERICESPNIIYVGSVNSTKVDIQKMVRIALDHNASSVIVAHNHPNGPDYPSPEDIETTRRIERLFNEISINFIDHYVVSDTKISSIKAKNIYGYIK